MARLDSLPEPIRGHLATLPCPTFETTPFVEAPPADERRVAMNQLRNRYCSESGRRLPSDCFPYNAKLFPGYTHV